MAANIPRIVFLSVSRRKLSPRYVHSDTMHYSVLKAIGTISPPSPYSRPRMHEIVAPDRPPRRERAHDAVPIPHPPGGGAPSSPGGRRHRRPLAGPLGAAGP